MITMINDNVNKHFYWFVILTTIMLYMYLRWKRNQQQSNNPKSNLVYLLLWPLSLYSIHHLFLSKKSTTTPPNQFLTPANNNTSSSTELMSSPYPNSDSISAWTLWLCVGVIYCLFVMFAPFLISPVFSKCASTV